MRKKWYLNFLEIFAKKICEIIKLYNFKGLSTVLFDWTKGDGIWNTSRVNMTGNIEDLLRLGVSCVWGFSYISIYKIFTMPKKKLCHKALRIIWSVEFYLGVFSVSFPVLLECHCILLLSLSHSLLHSLLLLINLTRKQIIFASFFTKKKDTEEKIVTCKNYQWLFFSRCC